MPTPLTTRIRRLPARRAARLAILARRYLRLAARVGAWTVVWTLFQWWAVIGWPERLDAVSGGMACGGMVGLLAAGVLLDVRYARRYEPAVVIPLRRYRDTDADQRAARELAA